MGSEETALVHDILAYLRLRGVPATRCQSGHLNIGGHWINLGEPGWPDIIGCLPGGRFLAVECKRPGQKLTREQERRLEELTVAGAQWVVATCLADVEQALTEV